MIPTELKEIWNARKDYSGILKKRDTLSRQAAEGKTLAPEDRVHVALAAAMEQKLPELLANTHKDCHKAIPSTSLSRAVKNSPKLQKIFCKLSGGLMERSAKSVLVMRFNALYPQAASTAAKRQKETDAAAAAETFRQEVEKAWELAGPLTIGKPIRLRA
jgi:hypothetical protein